MKKFKLLGLLSCILFISINGMSQSNDELKAKIEKLNKEMSEAMVAGNTEKGLSYYTEDVISMPNQSKMLEGKEAVRKSNEDMKRSGVKVTSFEATTLKVTGCEKIVTEIGKYKISLSIPGQSNSINDEGKYVTVWEKQSNGELKVKLEIWNSDINPMGNM